MYSWIGCRVGFPGGAVCTLCMFSQCLCGVPSDAQVFYHRQKTENLQSTQNATLHLGIETQDPLCATVLL